MSEKLSWGIISTGAIAKTLARALGPSRTGRLWAVASRSKKMAEQFGEEFNIPADKRYASYEELLADKEIGAVYVATPHPWHAEWAIKAAEAGKHVLVEKPIAVNQYQAQAMIEAAIENDTLLMEAFMYRCHPQTKKLVELIKEQAIGKTRVIHATFSFHADFDPQSRLYKNDMAGGGVLDIGCYPASISRLLAGAAIGKDFSDPIEVKAVGHIESTGVDGYTSAALRFPGDVLAQIAGGVAVSQENVVRIFGSQGRIVVPDPWVANRKEAVRGRIILERQGEKPQEIEIDADTTAFTMEVDVFGDAVAAGKKQVAAPAMSWDDSLGNIRTLDQWREQIGVTYEFEKPATYPKVTVANRPLKVRDSAKMKYGKVPGLDKKISRLVMGCDNQKTMAHAAAVFDAYFQAGGNAFDTAYIYGGGAQEKLLGQWIKNRGVRKKTVIIAKGAHTPECNPEALSRQLLQSLERLQTDHADLYLMHRDNPKIPADEFVDVLNEHVSAGRIRAFGGSNWTIARITAANKYAKKKKLVPFSILSNNFSLARLVEPMWAGCLTASDEASRTWLTQNQMPLFAWSSQARGFFTDRLHVEKELNDEELNRCWYSEDNLKRRARVIESAQRRNVLPINIALAYVLDQPFPTFPLIGPRTLEELRTSLPAMSVELSERELKWLNLEI